MQQYTHLPAKCYCARCNIFNGEKKNFRFVEIWESRPFATFLKPLTPVYQARAIWRGDLGDLDKPQNAISGLHNYRCAVCIICSYSRRLSSNIHVEGLRFESCLHICIYRHWVLWWTICWWPERTMEDIAYTKALDGNFFTPSILVKEWEWDWSYLCFHADACVGSVFFKRVVIIVFIAQVSN